MKSEIIYEDQEILVIHKPAGLATQSAGVGQPDVVSELKSYLAKNAAQTESTHKALETGSAGKTTQTGSAHKTLVTGSARNAGKIMPPYLGVVHRLDQPVEGLLVFAKTPASAATLTKQLGNGVLNKQYLAIVMGKPDPEKGSLTDYLRKDKNLAQVVTSHKDQYSDAKEARLHYTLLKTAETQKDARERTASYSLLQVQIETGRFHQIRAQLSHAGHPILGDQKYGNGASLELSRLLQVKNVLLCADRLEILHPRTGKKMEWTITPSWMIGL